MLKTTKLSVSYKNILFFFYAFLAINSFTNSAFAASTDVIGNTLCNVVSNLVTGGIAKSVATIAIFAIGVGLFMGKVNWALALSTVAGVGIIFSATTLIGWITGATISACTYTTSSS
jgi:type IV secretion system protein VirB2